ncbi:hypothetical protein PP178_03080 [Zeaxanthinibacter sp. PT1]|uniref:hypothetical protein n=1 Tax=Zeaxanthinibacter TaxID=561554 RepID=UPI0023496FDA|nr:hypothetical protein [Zeaxanthinibacter sp. PT1]MDC6350521.1 hypothetical protein [Zeaxanthinibacter sp. PT1]
MRSLLAPIFLGLFLMGCQSDDLEQGIIDEVSLPDLTVIGEDLEFVYRFNYQGSVNDGTLLNLSTELQLPPNYLTLRRDGDLLTFFSIANGKFSALQLGAGGETPVYLQDFYTISEERSVTWGAASSEQLFLAYYSPRGTKNLSVRIQDIVTMVKSDLSIAFNIEEAYDPIYLTNRLLVPYLASDGNYKLSIINTDEKIVQQQLDLGSGVASIIIEESGNLAIISRTNDNDYNLAVYDLRTVQLLEITRFNVNRFFEPGPVDAILQAGRLYYTHFYAQPAPVPFGPAIYDFTGAGNTILDMPSIERTVSEELSQKIRLTFVSFLPGSNLFAVGYFEDRQETEVRGGVLLITEAGVLTERITFPFAPSFIMERD